MYKKCSCLRCGYDWQPRIDRKPVQCPRCKSPFWSEPTKRSLSVDRSGSGSDTVEISGAPPSADEVDKDTDTVTVIHSEGYIRTAADISDTLPDLEKPSESDGIENSEKKIAPQIGDDTDDLLIISDGEKIATVSKSDVSKAVKDIGAPSPGSQDDLDRLKVELFDAVGALPLSPDDAEPPKGYWNCPHCKALNETENKTGMCSSCHEKVV